jgi:hypothetical protein
MSDQYPPSRSDKGHQRLPRPAKGAHHADLVEVILTPYGEATTYYVAWEVKPKDPTHGIVRLEVFVEPKNRDAFNYRIIAQHVSTSGDVPKVPPGVMLRGESGHRNIPPGTEVTINIWGDIQISDTEQKEYSYCRTVISGVDILNPCTP